MTSILIAEGDQSLRKHVTRGLRGHGFEVIETSEKRDALGVIKTSQVDLAIVGSSHDETWDGLEVVREVREGGSKIPLVLLNKASSEARAVAALRAGANDYVKYPFSSRELVESIQRNLPLAQKKSPVDSRPAAPDACVDPPFVGESRPIREIKTCLQKAAASDSNVLITGETGTGKELAAQMIHGQSPRRKKRLVCINCAALPDNLFESELFGHEKGAFTGACAAYQGKFKLAEGGTVLLDEVGDMSPYGQAKVLRAVESGEVYRVGGTRRIPLDARIVAASNQDLERAVGEGGFRKDLYFRLNVVRIHLPPLREHREDIPLLLEHYLRELNGRFELQVEGFTEEALDVLLRYEWIGNVRELKNLLEAVFINLPSADVSHVDLPKPFLQRLIDTEGAHQSERDRLLAALYSTNWNKSKTAEKLNWSRMTVYRKIAKYQIREARPGGTSPHKRQLKENHSQIRVFDRITG